MLPLLIALATTPITYSFPPGKPVDYAIEVQFQGYVPLFGGKDADIDVQMKVEAQGKEPDAEGNAQVVSEIKEMHVYLKEQEMPFTTESITRYFPKTTISMTPTGKVLKTDAPDRKLPIRLPGLHAKRFPEITYLPLEFPTEGIEENKPFTFKRPFGDSDVEYTVTPIKVGNDSATLDIKVHQSYTVFEDKFGNPVEEKDAAVRVPTDVDGSGSAVFDRKRGIVSSLNIQATAVGKATDIKSGAVAERKLATSLKTSALP